MNLFVLGSLFMTIWLFVTFIVFLINALLLTELFFEGKKWAIPLFIIAIGGAIFQGAFGIISLIKYLGLGI